MPEIYRCCGIGLSKNVFVQKDQRKRQEDSCKEVTVLDCPLKIHVAVVMMLFQLPFGINDGVEIVVKFMLMSRQVDQL